MEPLNLHHVGIAVENIERQGARYIQDFGYIARTDIIHDPVQTAYVQFLRLAGDSVYLELVAPDGPASKLTNAIRHGGGLNHLCYSTANLENSCRELRNNGFILVQTPVPAAAFNQRRIAWMIGKDRVLIELVERGGANEL
jgi:methylmalonyl-CoA/ethylmalonyl-CoA epimerase